MSSVHEFRLQPSRFARRARRPAALAGALARCAVVWLTERIRREYQFRRSTAALRELDDRLLADVGLTRVVADHGARYGERVITPDEAARR